MQNRDSRSYMTRHWQPAPPVVWLWVLVLLGVLGAAAALAGLLFL
ncbi:MAG: hypothetical protein R3D80_02910 [Paracoccaceae bacterium]